MAKYSLTKPLVMSHEAFCSRRDGVFSNRTYQAELLCNEASTNVKTIQREQKTVFYFNALNHDYVL